MSRCVAVIVVLALAVGTLAQFPVSIDPTSMIDGQAASDAGEDTGAHLATDRRGRWMAVWSSTDDRGGALGSDADVFVAISDDDGATWNTPITLPGAGVDVLEDLSPQVATDRRGLWIVVWHAESASDTDVYFSVTEDNGQSWTVPALVDASMASDSGDDFLPRLVTDTVGTWVLLWQTCDETGAGLGTDEDIVYARSTDDGLTWSSPLPLYSAATSDAASDVMASLESDGQGNWLAAWQSDRDFDGIGPDDDILYVRSDDFGATWSAPAALAGNATTDTMRDVSPCVVTDGQCNWVVAWHSTENLGGINTDFDVFRVTSNDNGMTWSSVDVLNGSASTDSGPDFGVSLTTDRRGNWVAAWTTLDTSGGLGVDSDLLIAHSSDFGQTWTMPVPLNDDALSDSGGDELPVIVADRRGGWMAAWHAFLGMGGSLGSDRDVLTTSFFIDVSMFDPGPLTSPGALLDSATSDVGVDCRPAVASDGALSWYAVWTSTVELSAAVNDDEDIFFARSGDNGLTWTDAIAVSDMALNDAGRDWNPAIAYDGDCVLVVAWASESIPGTMGITDFDIFFTRSEDHGLTWSPTARLKTTGATDGSGDDGVFEVSLATNGNGVWMCAWDSTATQGGSGSDADIQVAVSTDNGISWGAPTLLNSTATSDLLPDTFCRLAVDAASDRWIAVWDSFEPAGGTGTDRDIFYAVSDDAGGSWSNAAPLTSGAMSDMGEDALPMIASGPGGTWIVAWQSMDDLGGTIGADADIVFSVSADGGATWSEAAPVDAGAVDDLGFDSEPCVASDNSGNWVVAWTSTEDVDGTLGPDPDVFEARTHDMGTTWTTPAVLNSDAADDSSFERSPRLASNGHGAWLAVWESSGDPGSVFGADLDVLEAGFALPVRCPGDTTGDLATDFEDLNRVLELWAVTAADPEWDESVDVSPNGAIDFGDLNEVLTFFGTYCD